MAHYVTRLRRQWCEAHTPGHHTEGDLAKILKIQKGGCYFCAEPLARINGHEPKKTFTRDHLVSVGSRGSSNWPSNIVLTCHRCNAAKGFRPMFRVWRYIKRKKGSAFVEKRKIAVKEFDRNRHKLDEWRKCEVIAACRIMEKTLRSSLRACEHDDIRCKVKLERTVIVVRVGIFTFTMPAYFQSRIASMSNSRLSAMCDDLIAVAQTAGGLQIDPKFQ